MSDSYLRYEIDWEPIALSAAAVPRDDHGRWCKGPQCTSHGGTVEIDGMTVPAQYVKSEGDYQYVDHTAWHNDERAAFEAKRDEVAAAQTPLTAAQSNALGRYQSSFGMYHDVNGKLRAGETPDFPVDQLDSAIAASRLPSDTTLHRGIQFKTQKDLDGFVGGLTPGSVVMDRAYASTSLDDSHASAFSGFGKRPGVVMEIRAPRGTPFAYLGEAESELLLARGTPMRVVSVERGLSVSKFDNWDVVMEIVE